MRKARFSEYFKLNKTQWELDFVDIPISHDIPLFVDPYAISIAGGQWCRQCHDMIVIYFDMLIKAIMNKDDRSVRKLLLNLHEPEETHFGFSRRSTRGRGIGSKQAQKLYESFLKSEAVKSGLVYDISEAALMIEGIGPDKISDITTNIIKYKLIEYTQQQCNLHHIPMRSVASGSIFDFDIMNWRSSYQDLPVVNGAPVILVPKIIARQRPEITSEDYYSFIIDYLQQEHTKPGDALVNVLKNGTLKVYKKDVKEKYHYSRKFIADFTKENKKVLMDYRSSRRQKFRGLSDDEIEARQMDHQSVNYEELARKLSLIPSGRDNANDYHNLILGILQTIFGNRIRRPVKEHDVDEGRKRIDITYDNGRLGFFENLSSTHKIKCPYIIVECKNYSKDINNPELDQILGRFNDKVGFFGLILCREIINAKRIIQKQRDIVNNRRNHILVLSDNDIVQLLTLRKSNNEQGIDDYMEDKLKEILF